MGCGASSEGAADGRRTQDQDDHLALKDDEHDLVAAPLAKRMESKYPWEDMEPVPEDTTVVFILGGPGSGKSTQCKMLVKDYGYTHLVTGDLLRQEVEKGTAMGKWASDLMGAGKLVPDQLSITLMKKAMISASNPMMLIDGFPRSIDQVTRCEKGICKAHAVLFFDVSEEVAKQRRIASGGSAENFHSVYATFREQSLPVKEHFMSNGKCHVLDASQPPEVVYQQVKAIFEKLEVQRKQDMDAMAAEQRARDAGEMEEEEEEDASYEVKTHQHVPASHYNTQHPAQLVEEEEDLE